MKAVKQYSLRQFIEWMAAGLGMQIRWEGTGVNEVGYSVIASEARQSKSPVICIYHLVMKVGPDNYRSSSIQGIMNARQSQGSRSDRV